RRACSPRLVSVARALQRRVRIIRPSTDVWLPASRLALRADLTVDLDAVDRNVGGRLGTQAHLLSRGREHGDLDLVADHDALLGLACKNLSAHCDNGGLALRRLGMSYLCISSA